ncbi:MAG: hypothetical protein U0X92_18530 [Anaerolineales bacterium]
MGANAPGVDAVQWAVQAVELGAGEIVVTSIEREDWQRLTSNSRVELLSLFPCR